MLGNSPQRNPYCRAGSVWLVVAIALLFLVAGCGHGESEPPPNSSASPGKSVISEQTVTFPSGEEYALQLQQTEYMKPLTWGDPGFSMYEGGYRGYFSFVTRGKDGTLIDELGINRYFGNSPFGLMGTVVPKTGDYNKDGDIDFNIGTSAHDHSGEMKYVLFSINRSGELRHINARGYKEDGFIYMNAMEQTEYFREGNSDPRSIAVNIAKPEHGGYIAGEYIWTNGEYVFKKWTGGIRPLLPGRNWPHSSASV
jgi:hypothetical protein